jgi:hypothetical protein
MGKMAYKSRAFLLAGLLFAVCFFVLNADFKLGRKDDMLGSLVGVIIWQRIRLNADHKQASASVMLFARTYIFHVKTSKLTIPRKRTRIQV